MSAIFAHPWGLAALAGLPAILVLHLFWRRFRPRRIAGLFLWAPEARQILAGRTRDRLYKTASLVCELLAAAALALAAAGLSPPVRVAGRHVVIVLDGSASMSAKAADGTTFAERAAARARKEIEGLGAEGAATVIVSGPAPHLAAGPRGSADAALAAIEAYLAPAGPPGTPAAEESALGAGVSLAVELASGEGNVLALTDTPRPADAVPPLVDLIAVGEPRPNVGIVAAGRSLSGAGRGAAGRGGAGRVHGERVFVAVRNFSRSPARCELVFEHAGRDPVRSALDLGPGETAPVALPLGRAVSADAADVVQVRLEAPEEANALALDDGVELLPARFPLVAVENRLAGAAGDVLERALACVKGVRRVRPGGPAPGGEADDPDLVFCGSPDAAAPPGAWRVAFPGAGASGGGTEQGKRLAGPYVVARRHAVMEDVSLAGVIWAVAAGTPSSKTAHANGALLDGRSTAVNAVPLVSCGGRLLAVETGPAGPLASERTFVFRLDLARSNVARTPAWPVLIGNILEERRRCLPGVARRNVALGDTVRVRLPGRRLAGGGARGGGSAREFGLAFSDGGRRDRTALPGAGPERAFPARRLGTSAIHSPEGEFDRFRVNFVSPPESDLLSLGSASVEARGMPALAGAAGGRTPFAARPGWPVAALAAVALVACLADWFVLRRTGRIRSGARKE